MNTIEARLESKGVCRSYHFSVGEENFSIHHFQPPAPRLIFKSEESGAVLFELQGAQAGTERRITTKFSDHLATIWMTDKAEDPQFVALPHPTVGIYIDQKPLQFTLSDPRVGFKDARISVLLVGILFGQKVFFRLLSEIVTWGTFLRALALNSLNIIAGMSLLYIAWKLDSFRRSGLIIAGVLAALELIEFAIYYSLNNTNLTIFQQWSVYGAFSLRVGVIYLLYYALRLEFKRRITAL